MGHPAERRYTWDEYLALERESDVKLEYVDGYVYAMSGGTRAHSRLAIRLAFLLEGRLAGGPCATYSSDLKVWMPEIRTARYPDLSIVCGHPEGDTHVLPATTGPTVLFEVLSKSTEMDDRGAKFKEYATIATLRDYVLVSATLVQVEHWRRDPGGRWTAVMLGDGDELRLESVGVTVPVAAIYEGVELDPPRRPRQVRED